MELHHTSPPAYTSHNPADLNLPSVPQAAISQKHVQGEITLPDLRTVLSPDFQRELIQPGRSVSRESSAQPTRSLPRIDPGHTYDDDATTSTETAVLSPSEVGSAMSVDEYGAKPSRVSIDDPDVRIAAEALSGLGRSDKPKTNSPPSSALSQSSSAHSRTSQDQKEPLLQLFTKAHPWVGGTINGSLNAYSQTINYSPRLVQSGANLIERNITNPVVSTVSTVGRMTGVESGLRWYYGGNARQSAEFEQHGEDSRPKRRRLMDEEMDIETGPPDLHGMIRRDSQESRQDSLPGYHSSKPPSYREDASPPGTDRQVDRQSGWKGNMFVMTSGLGVALSKSSRDSLKFCLKILSESTQRVSILMDALKLVLEEYDQAADAWHHNHDSSMEKGERPKTPEHDEAARRLAGLLKRHSDDIWRTLQTVVSFVSNSAGGALPDNARQFVRNQLMSLPQRWQLVSNNQTGESETSRSGHRMIAFATEGLDMMSQVSQTLQLTLESAERWLARVGRGGDAVDSPQAHEKDHDMGNSDQQPIRFEQ